MIDEIRRLLETPDPALAERVVSAERPWHGKIYDVETDEVVCPDGSHGYREIARHHGGAGVAAVKDGKICLVRQWRVSAGRMTLEIPAGRLDEGETPDVCAARELSEETGYVADRVELVAHSMGAIGFTDECTHVYRAIVCGHRLATRGRCGRGDPRGSYPRLKDDRGRLRRRAAHGRGGC